MVDTNHLPVRPRVDICLHVGMLIQGEHQKSTKPSGIQEFHFLKWSSWPRLMHRQHFNWSATQNIWPFYNTMLFCKMSKSDNCNVQQNPGSINPLILFLGRKCAVSHNLVTKVTCYMRSRILQSWVTPHLLMPNLQCNVSGLKFKSTRFTNIQKYHHSIKILGRKCALRTKP